MKDPQRVLIGSSLHLIEVEEDDDRDIVVETNFQYVCLEILKSIGTDDFKSVYTLLISETRGFPVHEYSAFCRDILSRIDEVYEFQFTNLLAENEEDCTGVLKFLEFLEYDYIEFLTDLFSKLGEDPIKVKNLDQFLEINKEKIDQFTNTLAHESRLVLEFLRTYNWDALKRYLNKIIEKDAVEISIELRSKGEKTNGTGA
jgi:hypothetical protein